MNRVAWGRDPRIDFISSSDIKESDFVIRRISVIDEYTDPDDFRPGRLMAEYCWNRGESEGISGNAE